MVNAQEIEAQRHRLGLEVEIDATRNVHQTAGINQPRSGVQQNARINQPRDGVGATGDIVLPALPHSVKFTIISTMIQLLSMKGMFRGTASEDANQHLMNFVEIYKSQEIPGVNQTKMRLRLFPLSLTGEVTNWLNEMPYDSIRTWNELKKAFLE
ncbi:hypothetical protein R3W88_033645 [Solanum pinnatisectum]|uniref:Retrotransposon gag domain-containing protein n=1 Tax=Solanum pinnatisectum TaxID=50273 RepID=A0AAV9K0K8_9SOLN|nr:hypothetical protein R3W88_033645 [Solanum pinnatisectum]